MPSSKHSQLFQLAESDPKLRDELTSAHMFDFWDTRYHQWSDIINDHYPTILAHSPKLQFAMQLVEMARAYREDLKKQYEENSYNGHPKDLLALTSQAQFQLGMANWTIRNFFKEIELECPDEEE